MAGLYIHIPFCRQACSYCDFHFSTSVHNIQTLVNSILIEIDREKKFFENEKISTIYFGGGTPSLLSENQVFQITDAVLNHFDVSSDAEITLEANPDDLSISKCKELKNTVVNRLSIGVQSFHEPDLRYMNRLHNASQSEYSVKAAQDSGFENISVDLIYGTPTLPDQIWQQNIQKAISLLVPHISAYSLTIEKDTPLQHLIRRGKASDISDEKSADQMKILMQQMEQARFEHYEISNFSKPGFQSKHNLQYWNSRKYLGLGPSAHSFDGKSRRWNVANNRQYITMLAQGLTAYEEEDLSSADQFNEYVLTRIRTIHGVHFKEVETLFGPEELLRMQRSLEKLNLSWLEINSEGFRLSTEGKLWADRIASEFFIRANDGLQNF
jgi:oxygen-independent coproporphyrinogen III oxidase